MGLKIFLMRIKMLEKLKIDNVKDYLTTGSGVAIAQLLSFFSFPFIAKLSGPEVFGQYSFAISALSVLVVLASLRLEYSIYSIDKETLYVLKSAFNKIALFMAMVLSCFSLIVQIFDNAYFQALIGFVVLYSIASFEFYIQNNILEGRFKTNALMRVFRAFMLPISFYLLYVFGFHDVESILISFSISHVLPVFFLNKVDLGFRSNFIIDSVFLFKRTRDIIKYIIPAHLLSRYSAGVFVFVVGFMSIDKEELAFYALAAKFMIAPATIFISATADVIKREVKLSPGKALANFYKISALSLMLVLMISMVIIFFGEYIVIKVMGIEWKYSAGYAVALIPYMSVLIIMGPITHVYVVLGRQKYDFFWQVFNVVFVSLALFIGLQHSLLYGVWSFSLAYAFSITLSAIVCIILVHKAKLGHEYKQGQS